MIGTVAGRLSFSPAREGGMAATVNLDALIPREDFEVQTEGVDAPFKQSIQISELEKTGFFFGALRKPDFQRETAEWEPKRVAGLIRTFITDDLIPSVILWKDKDLLFVIDGSHRLSALIAWVQDDYGDGERSNEFRNHTIPDEQKQVAKRTKEMVEKEFGSYADHKKAIADPALYGPDVVSRARQFGSLDLKLQWVRGNAANAEDSFVRINQQAATITPQELELIKNRRKPSVISARAIIRRGTGHKYWSVFAMKEQQQIEEIATALHSLIFNPPLRYPIKSLDLPAGGSVYSAPALRMVYEFIALSVDTISNEDDQNGQKTIEYLTRCLRVMRLVLSNHPSSIGLHPAIYFYSWTGNQQPILFLSIVSLLIDRDRARKLDDFTLCRKRFEEFILKNRALVNQITRKFGTKDSGLAHLKGFYEVVLASIDEGVAEDKIVDKIKTQPGYAYLQPDESPYDGVAPTRMSTQVRAGLTMKKLLDVAPRCGICGGFVPHQAISIDHKTRREDGGLATEDNTQVSHPYCNTGFKEKEVSRQRSGHTLKEPK
jgi:hypothetical protein